jgi:hypothetical protein
MLALYKDCMVPKGRAREFIRQWKAHKEPGQPHRRDYFGFAEQDESGAQAGHMNLNESADGDEVERDLDELNTIREREDVEDVWGVPFVVSSGFDFPACSELTLMMSDPS